METIHWGIIGCGDVCEHKSGPAFYQTKHSALVAVMRRNMDKAMDFATRHRVPTAYGSASQLIHDNQIDAVYIATPPSTHMEYTLQALQAGKHVYVEKPMGLTHAECLRMNEMAATTGRQLFVAFYRRALPYFVQVKSLLEQGAIGTPLTVQVSHYLPAAPHDLVPNPQHWRTNKAIAGGGYFYDLAPHTLDILDFLLGEITAATGTIGNLGGLYHVEDTVSALYRFASGVQGTGQWCFVSHPTAAAEEVQIRGTKGLIRFSIFSFAPIVLQTAQGTHTFDLPAPPHIQQPLIQTIVDHLRGVGTCPSTGISGARTAKVMDSIMEGMHT